MTKLVLGIIAIGLLQLGFVAYTHLEEPLTVAMLPEQPAASANIPPSLITELPPAATERAVSRSEETDFSAEARPTTDEAADSSRPELAARRTNITPVNRNAGGSGFEAPKPARADDFNTVVISYTGRQAESASCDPPTTERPKSRSLMAKAAPVVKKPWEFIKAVGSKLN